MASLSVFIASVNKTANVLRTSINIQMGLMSDWTCEFDTFDKSGLVGAYRPVIGQQVIVQDQSANVHFTGVITTLHDMPLGITTVGTKTHVRAQANSPLDRAMVKKTYTTGQSLKTVVSDLVTTYLTSFAISLDAAMGTGPTLDVQTFDSVTFRDALNHLSDITGWVWRLDPAGTTLFMFSVGTKSASFSLTAANKGAQGAITWDQTRGAYANQVTVRYGPEQQVVITDTFTGTGAVSTWNLTYLPVPSQGFILSQGVVKEGSALLTLSAPGGGGSYTYNTATNVLTRAAGALGAGVVISIQYTVQFPQLVTVSNAGEIAANGVWGTTVDAPSVLVLSTATELANGLLRNMVGSAPKVVNVSTRQGLALPGDVITLTFTDRTINASCLIQSVAIRPIGDRSNQALYTFQCITSTEFISSYTDKMRGQLGLTSASSASSSGTISGSIIPALSGHFTTDLIAASGGMDEVSMRQNAIGSAGFISNSQFLGPVVLIGNALSTWAWAIGANYLHLVSQINGGAGRRQINFLDTNMTNPGGGAPCPFMITQDDAQTTRHYYLASDPNSVLDIGVPGAGVSAALSPGKLYLSDAGYAGAQGYWSTGTPTWTNVTVGNASANVIHWTVVGKTVFVHAWIIFGTTTAFTGAVNLTLPFNNTASNTAQVMGNTEMFTGTQFFRGRALLFSASKVQFINDTGGAATTTDGTHPFVWGNGCIFDVQLWYEMA